MIDPATVERIKSSADIVEVVGDYVHLIRRGANYMGLCPFHNERTPSFSVNKQRNFCYCFSCKKGGSPVNFIMEKEGLTYHEALLHLAKKYGIEVVERELTDEEKLRQSKREAMFLANEWAMHKMESDLTGTDEGRDIGLSYLTQRQVTDAAIKAFHLGYALDRRDELSTAAKKYGFDINVFKELGLVGTSQQGHDYDRFRGRVIFPILNTAGKVIAFGGRDLKGGLAKYINSPESELYKKSNELYGIYQAKSAIVSEDKCFLVEGYMDVIGMWQCGMKNVVASSGTALTDGQIAMIHRFTNNITLIYDGDNAGIKASLRGIDMLLSHKLNVKVLLLPDGDDPDSFARKNTPEKFKEYLALHETDIIRYKVQILLNEFQNDPQKRISAINSIVQSIAHIPDNVSRDVYVQDCSILLGMPEATIARSVAKARSEIVEKNKRERLRKAFPVDNRQESGGTSTGNAHQSEPQPMAGGIPASPETDATRTGNIQSHNESTGAPRVESPAKKMPIRQQYPLYPLEKEVIKYCIRYAFLNFCSFEEPLDRNDPGSEMRIVTLDVLNFVKEELKDSNLSFTVPLFTKVYAMLESLRPGFEMYIKQKMNDVDLELDSIRRNRYSEIGNTAMSVEEINREEKKLEDDLACRREHAHKEFAKEYPGRILGSDEDPEVRSLALELLLEKHQLSNIYLKDGGTEREEERLSVLVIRAIDEWKNEIINQRIKELFRKFYEASANQQLDEQEHIQAEINSLIEMRKEMAKCIGDRTIYTFGR